MLKVARDAPGITLVGRIADIDGGDLEAGFLEMRGAVVEGAKR